MFLLSVQRTWWLSGGRQPSDCVSQSEAFSQICTEHSVLVLSHVSVECEDVLESSSGTQLGLSLLASRLHRDSLV